jgi:hypothetical protein
VTSVPHRSPITRASISNQIAPTPARSSVFYLGPFRFESEIDIPELRTSSGSGELAVVIRLEGVPASIPDAVLNGSFCQIAPTEYLLEIPGTARYYVRNGNEVCLQIAPGAPIADVSTFLLGSVFGVLCHQNGLLPLHASAVEHNGVVTAFLGDSGAGKSTLAACLQRRGHNIVSDDICLLEPAPEDGTESGPRALRVIPVAGWLKLWNESLQFLGEEPAEENRVYSTDDKFRLYLPNAHPGRPRLGRVVFLARSPDSQSPPALQSVTLLEAIAGLMRMTYAGYVPALAGQKSRIFQQCAQVFQRSQAWRLTVPWGLDRIESVLDLLERDIFTAAQR